MKAVFKKVISVMTAALLTAYGICPAQVVNAEEAKDPLKEKIAQATYLLEEEIQGQYENVLEDIKEVINENGYDYPMTMKSYLDEGSPFKSIDYNGIIAAITAVNAVQGKDLSKRINADQLAFISWDIEEDSYTDTEAVKVDEYTQREDGSYEKTGYHFSTGKEIIGIYEDDGKGYFKKTGETTIEGKEVEKKYGCITLHILKPEDIITMAGLDPQEMEDEVARRKDALTKKISNETLRANVFLSIPKQAGGQNKWLKRFMEAIGYEPQQKVIMDGEKIAAIASTLEGMIPYEWGGKASHSGYDTNWWLYDSDSGTQNGLDCSGFVQWTYITAGFSSEITSKLISTKAMLASDLKEVTEDELQPGDVGVVERKTTNHCGIYAGDGKWYHCSSYNNTVVLAPYNFTHFYRVIPEEDEIELSVAINYTSVAETPKPSEEPAPSEQPQEQPQETPEVPTGEPEAEFVYTYDGDGTEEVQEAVSGDVMLLAQLITHEAENQGLNGWIAVGEVVKNRILSPQFPSTLSEVIFQKGQFTKASEITDIKPRQEVIDTAKSVLEGTLTIFGNRNVLFFRNAKGSTEDWGIYKYYTTIGEHQFYLGKEI